MKPTMKKLPVMLTTIALAGQLTLPAAALVPLQGSAEGESVVITQAFPDKKLQAWLLNAANLGGIGSDGVLTEEERLAVTRLDLSGLGLTSLEGLEVFPNLQELDCSRNDLTALDVSQNPRLVQLSCMYNRLTELNLSANLALEYLNCNFNRIGTLDLTGHGSLRSLYCEMNQMEELTLTGCAALKTIYCRNNQLEELLLTDNTSLEFIETFDNRLTSIDVSMLPNLRFLHIDHNRLTTLDMSHNTRLEGGGFVARNNLMEQIKLPVQPGLTVYLDDYEEQDPIEGHDRAVWFLDQDFRTPAPAELEAAGQTLYSQRIPNRYTVYFSANGGNGSLAGLPATWGVETQLPESPFHRYGYTFAGWNTQPRGDGAAYDDQARVRDLAGARTDGDRITLYAQWTANQYTIRLEPNGGTGEARTQPATYGQAVQLMANPFTNGDKEFAGWATTAGGSVRYGDQALVESLTAQADGTVTLYAVWRTSLNELQKPYLEQLDAAFQRYSQGDYTVQDWSVLSGAYTDAVGAIQAAGDTGTMSQIIASAEAAMKAVPTAQDRVEEIVGSWQAEHRTALDGLGAGRLTESSAAQTGGLAQAALADLAQDRLELRSTLTGQADRQLVVGLAAQQLQSQADGLLTLAEAARWVEGLDGLTLRPMEQVQQEQISDYQGALARYEALEEAWKNCISPTVAAGLEARQELAVEKRAEAQALREKYDLLDKNSYSAQGQQALAEALNSGLAAVRASGSVEAVRQAGALAWNQMSQVPTRDQEPATPPDDGSDGGGSNNGGGSNGGGSNGDGSNGGGAGGGTQKPSGGSVTVTDSKTGATAQVTTGADGRVTAQVTVPAGVAHATLRIPCAGDTGTVAVLVGADGSRRVLPRSVYQDGILTVRVDGSATLELVDGSRQFADVSGGAWYADSVQFTASRELFSGVGGGRFAPAGTMTRSMLVTVLHRLEGAPAAAGGGFQDVPQDSWYSQAAHWAAEQGITDGTAAGRFEPDGLLTRESLAVMLHRAAGRPGAAGEALEGFRGGRDTSDWAREAMAWACASGILTGDGSGGLRPRANITRAEAAAMLTRFVTQTTTA